MKLYDMVLLCFRNLTRSMGRTLLTVVGVVVGTCAITVMISIGIGMQASMEAMLAEMGDLTVIDLYHYGNMSETGETLVLDDKMIEDIKSHPLVEAATPFYNMPYDINFQIVSGRNDRYVMGWPDIIGVDPDALEAFGFELIEGDYDLSPSNRRNTLTLIVGEYASYDFRDDKKRGTSRYVYPYPNQQGIVPDPYVDLMTEADSVKFRLLSTDYDKVVADYNIVISGRLVEDYSKHWATSRGIFMDIAQIRELEETYKKLNKIRDNPSDQQQTTGYDTIKIKVDDMRHVEEVETYLRSLGFTNISSLESVRKPLEEQARQQQVILGCLGGISLFVAAIGIANTMFMSILERTREIGIMKVVGCFVNDIRVSFLMEASSIGFLGGVAGVALSFFISYLMNTFGFSFGSVGDGYYYGEVPATDVSIIPWWLVVAALIFSTIIGLVSGYLPANRAVKIEALEAIKHE